jgi:hypothetical protein
MTGYYGDLRQRHTPTKTMHYNGQTYHTGQKVIIKHLLFKPYKEMRKNPHTGEMFEASGVCTTGESVEVEGIITGFEANHRARPCIKYITPESDHYAGKIVSGLRSYSDFTVIR